MGVIGVTLLFSTQTQLMVVAGVVCCSSAVHVNLMDHYPPPSPGGLCLNTLRRMLML